MKLTLRTSSVLVSLGLWLAGCASHPAPSSNVPLAEAAPENQDAPSTPQSFGDESLASPKAPSPSPAARSEAESVSGGGLARDRAAPPSPRERAGLGTEFGESLTSHVREVSFVRDASRPLETLVLNYNDRRGAEALVSVRAASTRDLSTASGFVTLSVRDESGDVFDTLRSGDRTVVVGSAGQRYTLQLRNNTGHRFEAVGTVDGLDVVNGKPGTTSNRGYILMPFSTLEVEGFRTSTRAVAAFRFAAVADSYAAKTGNARNVGVIGVALFAERGDTFVSPSETRLRDSANPFPADNRFSRPPHR
jgi:hypothetical protein